MGSERTIHDDISPIQFVIPGLTRNPVFSWIPAFAGMTSFSVINVVAYKPLMGIEKKYVSEFMNQRTK